MSRVRGEPADVRARDDGRPVRFVWQSRPYTVRAILEHWVISREWWRDPGGPGNPRAGQLELEFWRVEATPAPGPPPGPCLPPCVYDLLRDLATGTWTLRY